MNDEYRSRFEFYFSLFFFFQAEDGIRDWSVTGVQTCALPISTKVFTNETASAPASWAICAIWAMLLTLGESFTMSGRRDIRLAVFTSSSRDRGRSEERRVGKECRSRWERYHERENGKEYGRMR